MTIRQYAANKSSSVINYKAPVTLTRDSVSVEALTNNEIGEVLEFLDQRPLHTIILSGLIRDNGIESEHNRGRFYGCRNNRLQIEAVALIGHLTMFEAQNERAEKALARKATQFKQAHLLVGEQQRIDRFWQHYSEKGQTIRSSYHELLLTLNSNMLKSDALSPVRRAEMRDLDLIVPVQAEMAEAESGINPLIADGEEFRRRCARRIEMGKTWVVVENNRLCFKTDMMFETPDVGYIEGVYVSPSKRNQGFGSKCLSHLCRSLLQSTKSVCLLVSELNLPALAFYEKNGFTFQCFYQNIFLQKTPILN